MKICHISTGYPISFQGGITNYVRALAEYQVKSGHDVWVLTAPVEGEFDFNIHCFKSNNIVPFKWQALNDKDGLAEIKEFLDEKQFDIIHLHMILDVDWDLYEVLKPYKYVVSLHDYYYLCPRIQMAMSDNKLCGKYDEATCSKCISWFNLMRYTNAVENRVRIHTPFKQFRLPQIPQKMTKERYARFKKLLENADMLLPVSNRVQEIYEESGIEGKYKMLHIGNITADRFTDEFFFDKEKEKIDVAMLGTLIPMKGADLFVKIAERVDKQKVNVHFYGRSASYAEPIKNAGIIDHGPYTQNDLAEILKNTDLGFVLSIWEDNGPQVVMEFINNHVPVIGTRLGGIPDFVNETNGFLFNPFSEEEVDELIDKINSLTREKIYELKKSIKPTTTTKEHCNDMDEVYKLVLS